MIYDDKYVVPKYAHTLKEIEYEVDSNGCWNCTSHAKDKDGYVRVKRNGKFIGLHRYAYEIEKGKINEGEVVMHLCDNPSCFNPYHLEVGTVMDNNKDKINKNRHAKGEKIGKAKLTEDEVLSIRKDKRSSRELGRIYGVSKTQILYIRNGKSWKHLGYNKEYKKYRGYEEALEVLDKTVDLVYDCKDSVMYAKVDNETLVKLIEIKSIVEKVIDLVSIKEKIDTNSV